MSPIRPSTLDSLLDTIHCTDCVELLENIPDSSIDLIASDPPYEINYEGLQWDKAQLDWESIVQESKRVLKPNGSVVIFQGWSSVMTTMSAFEKDFVLKNWIIYDRIKGRGTTKNLVSTREDILWFVSDKHDYVYNKIPSSIKKKTGGSIGTRNGIEFRAMTNVWTDISPIVPWSKERVNHPTQKPLQLMERIVTIFSNEGQLVLDPFCGSGSTLVAAKSLGRHFIGGDISEEYCALTRHRLSQV